MHVELKVITSSIMATGIGIGAAVLNAVEADHSLLGNLGPTWQALILALAPGLLTFATGYQTKHTPRPDLPAAQTQAPPST